MLRLSLSSNGLYRTGIPLFFSPTTVWSSWESFSGLYMHSLGKSTSRPLNHNHKQVVNPNSLKSHLFTFASSSSQNTNAIGTFCIAVNIPLKYWRSQHDGNDYALCWCSHANYLDQLHRLHGRYCRLTPMQKHLGKHLPLVVKLNRGNEHNARKGMKVGQQEYNQYHDAQAWEKNMLARLTGTIGWVPTAVDITCREGCPSPGPYSVTPTSLHSVTIDQDGIPNILLQPRHL